MQPRGALIRSCMRSVFRADMAGNGEVGVCNDISQVDLTNPGTTSALGECIRLSVSVVGGGAEAGETAADVAVAQTATRS